MLFTWHGDEKAAGRLGQHGPLADVVKEALALEAPTPEELAWFDLKGEPLDPKADWWGYGRPSAMELRAKREGRWPPDSDPNPYGCGGRPAGR